jgi:type I restriction enzyme R subunit
MKVGHLRTTLIRSGQPRPLTPTDLRELERMFVASGMAAEEVKKVGTEVGLGLFVRSLVGLDREAAKAAFSEFTAGRTLSANQIEFLNLIIDHLTEKGQMDPGLLYESPFTDKDPMGVNGVFGLSDAKAVVEVIEAVRRSAAA